MNTQPQVSAGPQDTWLDACAFAPRHHPQFHSTTSTGPTHRLQKVAPATQATPRPAVTRSIEVAAERIALARRPVNIAPRAFNSASRPVAKRLPVRRPAAAVRPQVAGMPKPLAAELHSFRQLSSDFFCPETSKDVLPEYIVFGLIALLGLAWPILAMLGVMAGS